MTYEEAIKRIKANSKISVISEKEIQHGKSIALSNGSIINCFTTGKHNVQGKNTDETNAILGESTKFGNRKIFVVYGHVAINLIRELSKQGYNIDPSRI